MCTFKLPFKLPITSLIFPGRLLVMSGVMTADYVQAGNALTTMRPPKQRVVRNDAKIVKTQDLLDRGVYTTFEF